MMKTEHLTKDFQKYVFHFTVALPIEPGGKHFTKCQAMFSLGKHAQEKRKKKRRPLETIENNENCM